MGFARVCHLALGDLQRQYIECSTKEARRVVEEEMQRPQKLLAIGVEEKVVIDKEFTACRL